MFVAEWVGRVKVFDSLEESDLQSPKISVDITDDVHSSGDRGLLGMKLDPQFGTAGHNYIYLLYAYDALPGQTNAPIHPQYNDGGDNCAYATPSECVISGRVVRIELNPATGVAVGGADSPPQTVLVQSWCQQFNSHSVGDLEFDSSGALLVSGGEGANYTTADWGQAQFENPCGDPENEGGSLRAQDVRTPADQTDYSGSIIRIDPATGNALPDNPLYKDPANPSIDNPDVRARRIMGYGFRNPFRFEIRPGTNQVYVGDVGQDRWEELDRLTSPPVAGQQALNFGWPCFEGGSGVNEPLPSWEAANKPLCNSLYASPGSVTPSMWAYGHGATHGKLFAGDECDPSPGSALSGLAFYEPEGVAEEDRFPEKYDGALLIADAARGCIWAMGTNEAGEPDPTKISNFATSDEESSISPADLVQGPEGAIFSPNVYGESIEEYRYFPGDKPPVAKLEASKVDGPIGGGFTVHFDAGASSDPNGDPLHYEWDLNGDGKFDDGEDSPTAEHTYTTATNVQVKVRVRDPYNLTDVATITLYPGDLGPPQPVILGPPEDLNWAIGDTISYSGSATDPDGDTLGAGLHLHWTFNIRHCPEACHTHPLSQSDEPSGSFVAPPHEYPSHLLLELTATDSRGRSVTVTRDVYPKVIEIGISSEPDGVPVTIEGQLPAAGPLKTIAGGSVTVAAPESATIAGQPYSFDSWSDGGAVLHEVRSRESTSLVARYRPTALGTGPQTLVPPARVKVTLASRPPGAKLSLNSTSRRVPFGARLVAGATATIRAAPSLHRHGRTFRFKEWRAGRGHWTARRLRIVAGAATRYLAVYEPR